ncbi:MAG: DUF4126 domain-containing protein [Planctomycetota bacterium]|nr:DUF4126 domain-containing protein [Planctomycetota bacterium]
MSVAALIHLVGSLSVFPSRAFIPAFVTSLLIRFGPDIPAVRDSGILQLVGSTPSWFTHDVTLAILGLLSVLELIATKNAEVRAALNEIDQYVKPVMAAVTALGLLSAADAETVKRIQQAGFGDYPVVLVFAGAVFALAALRGQILALLYEADPDDDLGLQKLIAWMEDLWAGFGILLVVVYPFLMLGIVALIAAGMYGIKRYLRRREEQSKTPCPSCQTPIYLCALACQQCGAPVREPRQVGFFGHPTDRPVTDRGEEAFNLAEKKRCPNCAAHLEERSPTQHCTACGKRLMEDPAFAQRYQQRVSERLPKVLLISFLFSLVPVIGLIPGIIYYRLALVAPFRRYVSRAMGCMVKLCVRVLILVLIVFQIVPLLGWFMLPLMAFVEYVTYRKVFQSALAAPPAPAPAPAA